MRSHAPTATASIPSAPPAVAVITAIAPPDIVTRASERARWCAVCLTIVAAIGLLEFLCAVLAVWARRVLQTARGRRLRVMFWMGRFDEQCSTYVDTKYQ